MARHHPLLLARETVTHGLTNPGKMKGVILKKHGHKREITWLSKYETKEQRDDKQCCGTDSRAVARSPWRRRCGCRGNAEGCRPRLPEGVLYARCTPSDCPPRSPPPHTDGERDLYTAINSNTGREKKTGVKSQCSASVKCLLTAHKLHKLHTINTTPLTNTSQSRQHLFTTTMFLLNADRQVPQRGVRAGLFRVGLGECGVEMCTFQCVWVSVCTGLRGSGPDFFFSNCRRFNIHLS